MLLSRPSDLAKYDVPDPVLDVLSRSQVQHISIIGRRGPFQAAFTAKEVREMMELPDAAMNPIDNDILKEPEGEVMTRQQSRIISLLKKGSRNSVANKTWSLQFFRSPTGLFPSSSPTAAAARLELSLAHTTLDKDSRAVLTGQTSSLPTDLVITSLGQRSEPTLNWYDPSLGHVRNVSGRVVDETGSLLRNVYTSGWSAQGAKGVLATTMLNAYSLVETILSDANGSPPTPPTAAGDVSQQVMKDVMSGDPSDLDRLPKEVQSGLEDGLVVTHDDWKRIDGEEIRRGIEERDGKEREKMEWEQMMKFLHRGLRA
jgi:adrenodoxin-NADP+ reductase